MGLRGMRYNETDGLSMKLQYIPVRYNYNLLHDFSLNFNLSTLESCCRRGSRRVHGSVEPLFADFTWQDHRDANLVGMWPLKSLSHVGLLVLLCRVVHRIDSQFSARCHMGFAEQGCAARVCGLGMEKVEEGVGKRAEKAWTALVGTGLSATCGESFTLLMNSLLGHLSIFLNLFHGGVV